jgi:hypothetical protein
VTDTPHEAGKIVRAKVVARIREQWPGIGQGRAEQMAEASYRRVLDGMERAAREGSTREPRR